MPLPRIDVAPTGTLNCASFPSKVWVHRVNTLERAEIVLQRFNGIEIDVVYESARNVFDVRHRDIPSIGLGLVSYFERLDKRFKPLYWVDIKNLGPDNAPRQLKRLLDLEEQFSLHGRMVIESPNVNLLSDFTDAGLITSYYLPSIDGNSASGEEIASWVHEVKAGISNSRVCAISADFALYPLITRYFGDADVLFWANLVYDRRRDRREIENIIASKRVKVLLVRQRSEHYR